MKIIINKEEAKEIQAVIDVMLKSAGIQSLQIANKMLQSIEMLPEQGNSDEKQNDNI